MTSIRHDRSRWFPFSATEFEIVLAVFALLESVLFLVQTSREHMLVIASVYGLTVYLSALIVHHRRSVFVFHQDGAIGGHGYLPYFRSAKRSLLLLHTDDDAPCDELLGLYSTLLNRGVEIRRVLFSRPERRTGLYEWVERFGHHDRLSQRFVGPGQAALTRHSFVVVDERLVLLSVPGGEAIDGEGYASSMVLRHLLVLEDPMVSKAFSEVHGQLWRRAEPFDIATASLL